MKRITLVMAALGALLATPVLAETYFGFHIGISNAPPPPRVYFREEPRVVYVPQSRVYVVRDGDYDMFRYGRFWYLSRGGYWYRARNYRGPFRVVDARYVPRAIYMVPARHWRHRHWDRDDDDWNARRDYDRDYDRGYDRGYDQDDRWSDDRDYDGDQQTYFGFHINIVNAPPPPPVYFRYEPELVMVPETRVYVARGFDYDMFRYDDTWYVCRDGYWYRSQNYRGPFQALDARGVPAQIYRVPRGHWKDWRGDKDRTSERYKDKDRDRGRGRSRGDDRDDDRNDDRDH